MNDKPTLFIGSSVEGLEVAQKLQMLLDYDCYSTIWDQGIFEPSGTAIHSLINVLNTYDFAVFVFTPDDITKLRNTEVYTARDNVIFELGLFIGRIGIKRTYFLIPRNRKEFHIPTDLAGVTPLTYDANHPNLRSALGPAASEIKDMMRTYGKIKMVEDKASRNLVWLLTTVLEHSSLDRINYDRILGILIHTFNAKLNVQRGVESNGSNSF
jgi:predicted nucleotide-binding protein